MLNGPRMPAALLYLWRWAIDLHGHSGAGMAGAAALTYESVLAWAVLMNQYPAPREVRALMKVDAALRGVSAPDKRETKPKASADAPWPEKKRDA